MSATAGSKNEPDTDVSTSSNAAPGTVIRDDTLRKEEEQDTKPPVTQNVVWRDDGGKIHVSVPPRLFVVPGVALVVGATIGLVRGGRATGLRFLAENAHRPPRTVKGWYFYNKTKNYRVLLGGMKGAAKESGKLVAISSGWVGIEEGLRTLEGPWNEVKEVGAGLGTAGLFCGVYRLPWKTTRQTVILGGLIGGVVKLLSTLKGKLM